MQLLWFALTRGNADGLWTFLLQFVSWTSIHVSYKVEFYGTFSFTLLSYVIIFLFLQFGVVVIDKDILSFICYCFSFFFRVFWLGFLRSLLCHCRAGKMLLSQRREVTALKNLTDKVDQWLQLNAYGLSLISIKQILVIFCPPQRPQPISLILIGLIIDCI